MVKGVLQSASFSTTECEGSTNTYGTDGIKSICILNDSHCQTDLCLS